MKKVLLFLVVAIVTAAVVSFGATSWSGMVYEEFSYSSTPANLSAIPDMALTVFGTNYYFSISFNPQDFSQLASSYSPTLCLTLPLTSNLSVIGGYEDQIGEGTFGGSKFNGPSAEIGGSFGGFGFGYWYQNIGVQYKSPNLNVYFGSLLSSTNDTIQINPAIYADTTIGPSTVFVGSDNNFFDYYVGAHVALGSATLYGLLNEEYGNPYYLVEAVANVGQYSFGAAYAPESESSSYWTDWQNNSPVFTNNAPIIAWLDFGNNFEINTTFGANSFDSVTIKGYTTIKNIEAEMDLSYSPTSNVNLTGYILTNF